VEGILGEAIARFLKGRMLTEVKEGAETIYIVESERRLTLEYYKNAVMHAFAPAAYFAAAVRALGRDEIDLHEVTRLLTVQQFLLRYEFILDPDAVAEEHERRAVAELVAYGAVELRSSQVIVSDRARVGEIANLTANFLESYLLLLLTAADGRSTWKTLPADALTRGRVMLAADELSRPEALNIVNLQNAARAFREDNVLLVAADGSVTTDPQGTKSYADDLRALLARSS
jgi:glycerol-3-phosphate O-acyltransferase